MKTRQQEIKEAKEFNYRNGQCAFTGDNFKVVLCDPRFNSKNKWMYELHELQEIENPWEETSKEYVIIKQSETLEGLFS